MSADERLFPFDPREQKTYYIETTPTRRAVIGIAKVVFPLFGETHVEGREHIPETGPLILCVNHVTNYDVIPIQLSFSRPIFFMGKSELFRNPLMDSVFRALGAFPVHRGERDEWAMQHARKVLEAGQVLGMFPEGTRSKGLGLRPAKTGAARLAIELDCPILPMALYGTHRMFKRFPRRTEIRIRLGESIFPNPDDTALALTDRMMFAMAEMLPENARGVYTEHPSGF